MSELQFRVSIETTRYAKATSPVLSNLKNIKKMYNQKDIQFAGKHDYDRNEAERFANNANFKTFSVGIFQWVLNNAGNRLKRGKVVVRVSGSCSDKERVFQQAEIIVSYLDSGLWDGRKTVHVK